MNMDIIAAVLHLREAARLLQGVHPRLSETLLNVANAFTPAERDKKAVEDMESAAQEIAGTADGSAD